MKKILKTYFYDDSAMEVSISHMIFIVIALLSATVVGYMIFNAIKKGQQALGEDFIQGG